MTEAEFHQLADDKIDSIEQVVESAQDDLDWAMDWENSSGVLTLIIEANKSQVIISRQPSIAELWVAAKSGGYHFTYQDGVWTDKTNQTIEQCIEAALLAQGGITISL